MLLNPYLYHRAISINTKATTNFSSLVPQNTWRTLSINLISDENYYQEEKIEIQEEKKIFFDNAVEDEEQSMDEEFEQIQENVFDELNDNKAPLFFEEKNIGIQDQNKEEEVQEVVREVSDNELQMDIDLEGVPNDEVVPQEFNTEEIEEMNQAAIGEIEKDQVYTNPKTGTRVILDNISEEKEKEGGSNENVKNVVVSFF
tara:strand:- start:349 stop:951 length:603 start_codon:yes stop_codon:yes gene_type:complete